MGKNCNQFPIKGIPYVQKAISLLLMQCSNESVLMLTFYLSKSRFCCHEIIIKTYLGSRL